MPLKIYFAGSMRGGREDAALYARLVEHLKVHGTILTEYVGNEDLLAAISESDDDKYCHDQGLEWLEQSDVLVAEVTQPSLGVGYEIGRAVTMKKPILCLYRPSPDKRLSAMLEGAKNGTTFVVRHYKEEEVGEILKDFLGNIKKYQESLKVGSFRLNE